MKILVIEDDFKILEFIKAGLIGKGFSVDTAIDGASGLDKILNNKYSLLILDVMLPGIDGLTLLRNIRNENLQTPVVILSAKITTEDRIAGLDLGCDDYLTKPFSFAELVSRINALLRRVHPLPRQSILLYHELEVDLEKRTVKRENKIINLQTKEFALLVYFMQNQEKTITKSLILEKIWGYDFDPQTNVIDVLVCRLRNKIDKDFSKKMIQNRRGIGYVLKKD